MTKRTILFIVTNGVGLGHLTRGLAVASKMRATASYYEYIFLTTSLALDVLKEQKFKYYYVPSREKFDKGLSMREWYQIFRKKLLKIMKRHNVVAWVYDGAFPYIPLLEKFDRYPNIKKIWLKREGDRQEYESLRNLEHFFHLVIIPGEIGLNLQREKIKLVNPIVYVNEEKELDKISARRKLIGLFKECDKIEQSIESKLYYVQLGAGKLNDIHESIQLVINCILKNPNNYIVLGESIIGNPLKIEQNRVVTIREYPNSSFFSGVDKAVSAAGYNTYYELLYYGIPTVFIPNTKTMKDNQVARAYRAQSLNAGLCAISADEIASAIECMDKEYMIYKKNLHKIHFENGVVEACQYILDEMT